MRLSVNNTSLDFKAGTKIRFTIYNNIWSTQGSFSFPFSLAPTYKNRAVLRFPSRLSIATKQKQFDSVMEIAGKSFQCSLFILDVNDTEIRVSVLLNDTLFIQDGKTPLNELQYGEISLPATDQEAETYFNSDEVMSWPDANTKFCLPEFVKTDGGFFASNCYIFWDVHAQGTDAIPGIKYPESGITPQFYLRYIFNQFISDFKYKLIKNDMWSLFDLQCLFVQSISTIRYSADPAYRKVVPGEHLPCSSFLDMMERIKHTFGAVMFKNHFNREVKVEFLKDIIKKVPVKDFTNCTSNILVKTEQKYDGIQFSHTFNETDDYWKENVKDIRKEIVKGTYISTAAADTNDLTAGDIVLIESSSGCPDSAFYRYTGSSPQWEFYCWNYQSYEIGDMENAEKWNKQISGSITRPWDYDYNYHRYFISPLYITPEDKRKEFSLRLLFYRGKQLQNMTPVDPNHPDGIKVPMASNDVFSYTGDKLLEANLAMRNDGQYGLIENFWKDWINWTMTRRLPVSAVIKLSFQDIFEIDFSEPIRIESENYIIDKLEFEVDIDDQIEFVNADLVRL